MPPFFLRGLCRGCIGGVVTNAGSKLRRLVNSIGSRWFTVVMAESSLGNTYAIHSYDWFSPLAANNVQIGENHGDPNTHNWTDWGLGFGKVQVYNAQPGGAGQPTGRTERRKTGDSLCGTTIKSVPKVAHFQVESTFRGQWQIAQRHRCDEVPLLAIYNVGCFVTASSRPSAGRFRFLQGYA